MDHVAILRKANISKGDNLLQDILDGTKTIESRWYVHKISPWNKIRDGETIYFKESGCPVTATAIVAKVLQFDSLNTSKIKEIVKQYGKAIAPNVTPEAWNLWAEKQESKKYCILVFLKNVKRVPSFNIDKTGYGISSAWLVVKDINQIKVL